MGDLWPDPLLRLAPFLPEIVEVLEREGELKLPPDTKRLFEAIYTDWQLYLNLF